MSDQYTRELLRISVAQICQAMGYTSTQSVTLELLQDIMHKYQCEFSRSLRRQVEHDNRTDANLDDALLTLNNMNVNLNEMLDYVNNVEPVPCVTEVPRFPAQKTSNLNFLKPGSKEVLTRPVHINEHLPPILPPEPSSSNSNSTTSELYLITANSQNSNTPEAGYTCFTNDNTANKDFAFGSSIFRGKSKTITGDVACGFTDVGKRLVDAKDVVTPFLRTTAGTTLDEEGRASSREISSVVMTRGGFISPAVEGKLPDTIIPNIIEKLFGFDDSPPWPPIPSTRTTTSTLPLFSPTSITESNISNEAQSSSNHTFVTNDSETTFSSSLANNEHKGTTTESSVEDFGMMNLPMIATLATKSAGGSRASTKFNTNKHESDILLYTNGASDMDSITPFLHGIQDTMTYSHSQTLTMAPRLLKKDKKKIPSSQLPVSDNIGRIDYSNSSSTFSTCTGMEPTLKDKTLKKCLKMFQKVSKSNINETVDSIITGHECERPQLDKFLKKQSKEKQKHLKQQQVVIDLQHKPSEVQKQQHAVLLTPDVIHDGGRNILSCAQLKCSNENMKMDTGSSNLLRSQSPTKILYPSQPLAYRHTFIESIPSANQSILHQASGEISHQLNQPNLIPIGNKTSLEIKLSTEPDRTKLNIFKKISKQKVTKSHSHNICVLPQVIIPNSPTTNEKQVINLPSGTTITPAPSIIEASIYASGSGDGKLGELRNRNIGFQGTVGVDGAIFNTDTTTMSPDHMKSRFGDEVSDPAKKMFINKPKKRGRKPGIKNYSKVSPPGVSAALNENVHLTKKSKKMKIDKALFYGSLDVPHTTDRNGVPIEPLNLTNLNKFGHIVGDFIPNIKPNFTVADFMKPFATMSEAAMFQAQLKERTPKEQMKKSRTKNVSTNSTTGTGKLLEHTHAKMATSLNVPTKEEVNSINKKLMRMDTVLKPAPPLSSIDSSEFVKTASEHVQDNLHSPTTMSISKKRIQQRSTSGILAASIPPTPFVPTTGPIPNFQGNMLSMLPIYPFATRPGLIPSPGLFPTTGLSTLPSSSQNSSSSNVFLSRFLPFPKLKSPVGKLAEVDFSSDANNDQNDSTPSSERSYCNVAPLVPESMKLTPPSPSIKSEKLLQQSFTPPSHCENSEYYHPHLRTPKTRHSPTLNAVVLNDIFQKKFNNMCTPDSQRSDASCSLPVTPGGISLGNYEAITRQPSTSSRSEISLSEMQNSPQFIDSPSYGGNNSNKISSGNRHFTMSDLIELSDDSSDVQEPAKHTHTISPCTTADSFKTKLINQSFIKPASLKQSLADINAVIPTNIDDLLKPHRVVTNEILHKETKKLKKLSKSSKKDSVDVGLLTPHQPLDLFGEGIVEKIPGGVSKLAGGADLIPLTAGTGLAYSAKTIPSSSLTVASATPHITTAAFPVHKREFGGGTTKMFNHLNIMPTSVGVVAEKPPRGLSVSAISLQKKRKDHKKMKKVKQGKIKKKKDKKDKNKNKEGAAEMLLYKGETKVKEKDCEKHRDNKNFIKRMKKERKREKQRMTSYDRTMESSPSLISTSKALKQRNYPAYIGNDGKPDTSTTISSSASSFSAVMSLTPFVASNVSDIGGGGNGDGIVGGAATPSSSSAASISNFPKITFKIANNQASPPAIAGDELLPKSAAPSASTVEREEKELSPELARISPLVTRPPKHKQQCVNDTSQTTHLPTTAGGGAKSVEGSLNDHKHERLSTAAESISSSNSIGGNTVTLNLVPPPSPWLSGGTLAASSVLLPQQLFSSSQSQNLTTQTGNDVVAIGGDCAGGISSIGSSNSTSASYHAPAKDIVPTTSSRGERQSPVPLLSENSRPSSYIDAEGNRVWICPACGKVDDGSAMIGCDGCDAWYHWICVGIFVAPKDNEDWFCRVCITRKKGIPSDKKQRKRNKKK